MKSVSAEFLLKYQRVFKTLMTINSSNATVNNENLKNPNAWVQKCSQTTCFPHILGQF